VSPNWNGRRGAVTWGDGSAGVSGPVSADNSLVGASPQDLVGYDGVAPLSNGNYLVASGGLNGRRWAVSTGGATPAATAPASPRSNAQSSPPPGLGAPPASGSCPTRGSSWLEVRIGTAGAGR